MKSMRGCSLIDKYRDKELSDPERSEFESHLAMCENCRTAIYLLNNVAYLVGAEEVRSFDLAGRITHRAFQKGRSWDSEIISWLRPGPVLAALSLTLALFSFMLMTSTNRQVSTYSEYEKLMDEAAESSDLGASLPQVRNNIELVFWLEQEGIPSD